MTYLFLDTNIFLHFTFFDEIKWKELVGDDFQIVLAPTVIDELDKHKRHPNRKIADRAKKVLAKIEQIEDSPELYPLQNHLQKPKEETFSRFSLQRQEQDDAIIATILEFMEQDSNRLVKFVTHDTGPRLRAKHHGIQILKIQETLLMPNEKSEEEKLIAKLTSENSNLKNKIPKVKLAFSGGEILLKHRFIAFTTPEEKLILEPYQAELEKIKPMALQESSTPEYRGGTFASRMYRSATDPVANFNRRIETYNEELEAYFKKYLNYLSQDYDYQLRKSLSLVIDLELFNQGNIPAEDIDIWLSFPDRFLLFNTDNAIKEPQAPAIPYRPKDAYDEDPSSFSHESVGPFRASVKQQQPLIRKTNRYEVRYHYNQLKHNVSVKLDPVILEFINFEEIKSFTIDYKLIISNVPDLISGSLNVVLTK